MREISSQRKRRAQVIDVDRVRRGLDLIDKGLLELSSGPRDYYIHTLLECYEYLLTLAPHQSGDRVRLTITPKISEGQNRGWLVGKHFLKKGAVGTVREIRAYGDGFVYSLEFAQDPGRLYGFKAREVERSS